MQKQENTEGNKNNSYVRRMADNFLRGWRGYIQGGGLGL